MSKSKSKSKSKSNLKLKSNPNPNPKSKSDLDLKSMIHQHSLFFDNLVELIPARFYLSTDDNEKPWFQGLSKAAKASAKREARENIKKARRARFDPDKSSTTLDLLKQTLQTQNQNQKPLIDDLVDDGDKAKDQSVSYEELREKFRIRMEELRSQRNADASDTRFERKRKRTDRPEHVRKTRGTSLTMTTNNGVHRLPEKTQKDVEKASEELTFGFVKLGNEEEHERGKKKRKLSKAQALEQAKKLEEAKRDPEKGSEVAKKHALKAAMDRAAGIKVHDDPKIIKLSIKKDKKRQEKNAEKWKDRIGSREKERVEKQQTRSANITERAQQKKARKIAKREKKLMRPGFEGRKEGFINASK
ncbi:hypothetical protein GIB67_033752 [Kingdonia uniflora]|uniref:Uncharacterized protein n=1 Tax=Kingdonia uniflora TaxID=39325 RepID=A0A7J7P4E7_9MAGN|nr:hypothetical protein GIB67_033752 [Kingdonia uniflora]